MGVLSWLSDLPALMWVLAAVYIFLDGHYWVRMLATLLVQQFLPRVSLNQPVMLYTACLPTDLDLSLHMNNARYLREMDFGRWSWCVRVGLQGVVLRHRLRLLLTAALVRYRRPVQLGTPLQLHTQLLGWDDSALYFEQQLVALADGRSRCVCVNRLAVVGRLNAVQMMQAVFGDTVQSPPLPSHLLAFSQANTAYQTHLTQVEKRA